MPAINSTLLDSSKMTILTDKTLPAFLLESTNPVLVDFWATWCGPCLAMAPVLETLDKEWANVVLIAKIDVDDNPITARKYGIMSIPTLMLFKKGRPVERITGVVSKAEIQKRVKNALMD
jgi:thioredoxin 1